MSAAQMPDDCDLCGDVGPLHARAKCHPTAPLRAELADGVLTLRCYVPHCNREVARLTVAESPTTGDDPVAVVEARARQIVRDMEALGELAGRLPEADYLALAPRVMPLIEEADARVRQKFPHLFGGAA